MSQAQALMFEVALISDYNNRHYSPYLSSGLNKSASSFDTFMNKNQTPDINTPTFIDFEASSLDLVTSYPIEVGICLPDGNTKSWLIKPHVIWQDWSAKAARVHGIPKQTLIDEGEEISFVVKEMNDLLKGPIYCDAWAFDSFWLHRLFKAANTKANFELDSITSILDEKQIDRWQETRSEVIESLQIPRHRAANDAYILHKTWQLIGAPS